MRTLVENGIKVAPLARVFGNGVDPKALRSWVEICPECGANSKNVRLGCGHHPSCKPCMDRMQPELCSICGSSITTFKLIISTSSSELQRITAIIGDRLGHLKRNYRDILANGVMEN